MESGAPVSIARVVMEGEVSSDPGATRRMGPAALHWMDDAVPPEAPELAVEFAQATHVGRTHETNEDAIGCWTDEAGLLFAVADGVSGCDAGEVASLRALTALADATAGTPAVWGSGKRLRQAVAHANLAVPGHGETNMRTTLTATLLEPCAVTTAHVGDCRLLRLRSGVLQQLTTDHSVARSLLTRSLGQDPFVRVDLISALTEPGDIYLQCSDGVTWLPSRQIAEVLVRHEPAAACERLLERVLEQGGEDDASVQVVAVLACPPVPLSPRASRPAWRSLSRFAGFLRGRSTH